MLEILDVVFEGLIVLLLASLAGHLGEIKQYLLDAMVAVEFDSDTDENE